MIRILNTLVLGLAIFLTGSWLFATDYPTGGGGGGGDHTISSTSTLTNKTLTTAVIDGAAGAAPTVDVLHEDNLVRAWVDWGESGGTPSVTDDFNFTTSVTDNDVGDYTFFIDTDMTGIEYAVVATGDAGGGAGNVAAFTKAAGSIRVFNYNAGGSAQDQGGNIVIFGDQ